MLLLHPNYCYIIFRYYILYTYIEIFTHVKHIYAVDFENHLLNSLNYYMQTFIFFIFLMDHLSFIYKWKRHTNFPELTVWSLLDGVAWNAYFGQIKKKREMESSFKFVTNLAANTEVCILSKDNKHPNSVSVSWFGPSGCDWVCFPMQG